ncbi:hypothetical protein [Paraburkholderia terricola]|uniref:Uncharacterized protein n=1 Tax=Paraburkholderia terricola TaxID=169427 RepID=A0A1M6WR23_9BURK|nr:MULTISPECIES: hypothetical protein [Paraburkholderia]SDP11302.1 hypothetical protein SAMN05192547_104222 [Paraburkholderia sediminicola]SHK96187.1 hypothetical protein SAMN05192548_104830 [Paraburkholderia terricola]
MTTARMIYMLELARGCSHIASMLTAESEQRAITDTLEEFLRLYGVKETTLFQELLADDLHRREKTAAASAVRNFKAITVSRGP